MVERTKGATIMVSFLELDPSLSYAENIRNYQSNRCMSLKDEELLMLQTMEREQNYFLEKTDNQLCR